jgi:hypothetical protein
VSYFEVFGPNVFREKTEKSLGGWLDSPQGLFHAASMGLLDGLPGQGFASVRAAG